MATTSTSTAVATVGPVFTEPERLALARFLAGYTGLTREAYALDLRQYASWCQQNQVRLFQARRADIECFARDLEARGRARATITRRLCTIAGFYKYAVEEDLLEHSPAAHVRRPRLAARGRSAGPRLARWSPRRRPDNRFVSGPADLKTSSAAAKDQAGQRWSQIQETWKSHLAKVRSDADDAKANMDADRAERRAKHDEDDAAAAVEFAFAALDEAEYQVLKAAQSRQDADAAAAGN